MKSKHNSHELQRIDSLYDKITTLIEHARKSIVKNVNSIETYCKFETGKFIIEDELEGKYRASYGKKVLILLSEKLTNKYGHGWSVETLTLCRKFYTVYSKIVNSVYEINHSSHTKSQQHHFNLSWSHYLILMRIENHEERRFYEIESYNQNWSVRHLQRQVASSLYERLALRSRQKRFTFDEDNFFVDLVFYNRLLQCYVLIDLKTDKLTHQDLGQMQMYVNYFDRYIKQDFEKPTIGILLCETKNDSLVELTLPKDANIYAQQYALCLPDKKLLKEKLKEWIDEFNEQNNFPL